MATMITAAATLCLLWSPMERGGAPLQQPTDEDAHWPVVQVLGRAGRLRWRHSIEKLLWEETYRAEPRGVRLVTARVWGAGAGMEPPPDAVRDGEGWVYHPDRLFAAVTLTHSPFVAPYEWCDESDRCRPLEPPNLRLRGSDAGGESSVSWQMVVKPCEISGSSE